MNVRRCIAAATVLVAAPVLSSCGVSFGAQTDQVYNPSAGVADRDGSVAGETTIPADGLLNLATQSNVGVTGKRVVPGNFVSITFSFDRAAAATLEVPVMSADDPDYAKVPLPSGS